MSDELLEAFKDELTELARLKQVKKETEVVAEAAAQELSLYEQNLWERMDMAGIDSSPKWRGLGQFARKSTVYAQVTDRDALVAWAEEQGLDDVVELKEAKGRLNEIVRDRLDTQQELPPGVSFYERRYIAHTKSKS